MINRSLEILLFILLLFPCAASATALQDRLYDKYGIEFNGFAECRQGWRLQNDKYEKDASISETRLQLDLARELDWGIFRLKGDFVGDYVENRNRGELRELNFLFYPLDYLDVKVGRQVLTWGTGDLLFINDLFAKDWESFFIGRDDEYLKGAADAVKMSFFFDLANIDLVYGPVFNGSNYIDGARLSYWNALLGRRAGRDFIFSDHERNRAFDDWEAAFRVFKNIYGAEAAVYGYHGYWKTPEGLDPVAVKLFYPELTTFGASVRGSFFKGIGNLEVGYYDSGNDPGGDDPLVRNSEVRFLAGFERELGKDFAGGFQYYLEWMADYDAYRRSVPGQVAKDEYRHVLTIRLTKFLFNQNLRLSLFCYYSPSDQDAYIRPKVHYKVSDQWAVEAGGNLFVGTDDNTFFGQFQRNTNAYAGLRWGF